MTEQQPPIDNIPAPEDKEGAWAGKRDAIQPEEQTGPPKAPAQSPATQAQDKQQGARDSGAELPA
jgi:hypothetical protein